MDRSIADELYSDIGEPKAELGQTSNTDVKEPRSLDGKDDEWCEDELSWNGSDGELDPSSDLDREWQRRKKQFHSIGYRDGLLAGKEASAQEGFNVGFKESVLVGYDWGLVRGVTGALNCLPGELREKIIDSQETKTKFHNLYESVNNLSTTDALKLYNDDISKRRVREGKQNSDGSVLDRYHQQLRSLVLESPAIEVQFRDKSIDVLSTGQDPSLE